MVKHTPLKIANREALFRKQQRNKLFLKIKNVVHHFIQSIMESECKSRLRIIVDKLGLKGPKESDVHPLMPQQDRAEETF